MKNVSDEVFEKEYSKPDNKNIIRSVTKKYSSVLSDDMQKTCGMQGLWKCIQNHRDERGSKFTTSLFMHVDWECKREVSSMLSKKHQMSLLGDSDIEIPSLTASGETSELLDILPEKQKQLVYQRYYENMTLQEIGEKNGYSKEAARQNINKVIDKLKEIYK